MRDYLQYILKRKIFIFLVYDFHVNKPSALPDLTFYFQKVNKLAFFGKNTLEFSVCKLQPMNLLRKSRSKSRSGWELDYQVFWNRIFTKKEDVFFPILSFRNSLPFTSSFDTISMTWIILQFQMIIWIFFPCMHYYIMHSTFFTRWFHEIFH